MEVVANNFMPGDSRLVEQLVYELKSQGIFDRFRKECISDVDTKPAYQNLRQRVEGSVSTFLKQQTWSPDMNKNQVREQLRKNIYESGYLETGVERIVDQVVNPKINTIFLPEVEDVVYRFLGIVKPIKKEVKINIADLLPTDLEAVSPESVHSFKDEVKPEDHSETLNDSLNSGSKPDEDESPPFEPLDPANKITNEEYSVDSHLSGFSGLQSHGSNHSGDNRVCQMEISSQDSQVSHNSSESRLSIITSEEATKMDVCDDSSSNLMKSITNKTPTETSIQTTMDVDEIMPCDETDNTGDFSIDESFSSSVNRKENESSSDNTFKVDKSENDKSEDMKSEKTDDIKSDEKHDKSVEKKSKSSDRYSRDRRDDKYRKSSSSKDISSSKHSSSKDRDRNRKDSKSSSTTRDKEKTDKNREKTDRDKEKKDKVKEKTEKDRTDREKDRTDREKERDVDKSAKDKEKSDKDKSSGRDKERSDKPKDKSEREKLDKDKVKTEKLSRDREKSTKDKERDKSDKERSDKDKDKERSDKDKDRSDKEKDRSDKERERSDKERERSDKEKDRTDKEKERSDKKKERSDKEKERSEKDKAYRDKDKSDRERSSKDKDKSAKHRDKSDKEKTDKNKEKYREKDKYYKEKSSKEKETLDKEKSSDSKTSSKDKNDRPSSSSKKEHADKDKSRSSNSSSSRDKSKLDNGETKSRSSTDKSRRESKHSVNGRPSSSSSDSKKDKDKKRDSKKQLKDDHYSSKDKKHDRRSTDRDSNDGHSSKPNFSGSCSENNSSRSEKSSQDLTSNSGSGDSGNSDQVEQSEPTRSEEPVPVHQDVQQRLILPKFASNFMEIRKIMKIRKQLALLEKQKRLGFTHIESQVLVENGLPGKSKVNRPVKQKKATKKQSYEKRKVQVEGKENVQEKKDIEENVRLGESLELICEEVEEAGIVGPEDAEILLEQNTEEIRVETPESPWDSTSLKSTELSQENWEALEARLAQEMSTVNCNSYESDEEMIHFTSPQRKETMEGPETSAVVAGFGGLDAESSSNESGDFRGFLEEEGTNRSLEFLRSFISESIRLNPALADELLDQKTEVKREGNAQNDNKQLSIMIDKNEIRKNNRIEPVIENCHFLEKPADLEVENLRFLHEFIGKLEEGLRVCMEAKRANAQPAKRGRKRKLEEIVDVKNNNRDHYEQIIVRKRGRPPGSHTVISKVNKEKMFNTTDLITHEKFSLPLSPAESDKSNDKKEEELHIPEKRRRIIATQRYSSEDLYKPRPIFCRRNKDARKS